MSAVHPARFRILIVGAALFLREHHEVTVLERYNLDFERNDYAISVAPNTHRLLLDQGMLDANLEATDLTKIWIYDADGTLVRETLAGSLARYGTTTIFTRRSKLHAELFRLATADARPGKPARVVQEVKIQTIDVANGTIITESGEAYHGDLIIGADGINSIVRAAVVSANLESGADLDNAAAVPSGLVAYICTVPNNVLRDDPFLAVQTGDELGMAAFYCADRRKRVLSLPSGPEKFQVTAYHPEDAWVDKFGQRGSSIIKDVPAELVVRDLTEFHPSIQKLVASATACDVWRIRDMNRISRWRSGKTILIGDAAHAATPHAGQGGNIAIEDGEALAYFLHGLTSASQISAALESFEKLRIPRAHLVQLASRQMGGFLSEEEREKSREVDLSTFMDQVYGYTTAKEAWEEFNLPQK
ncbi:hypothetical protein C8R43DRAFT_948856 [Mycena crocata]|nr:hypothetical protein C8R43DRAFT_948856 [Mycena crocata]